jgi:hypothetical protein
MIKVEITGFKTKEEVEFFLAWYSNEGEQHIADSFSNQDDIWNSETNFDWDEENGLNFKIIEE